MARLSKKRREMARRLEAGRGYTVEEAVALLAEFASPRFAESIDVSVNLGVDPRKSDQVVRGAAALPAGSGKTARVAVFAQGEAAEAARRAGADAVGLDDLAARVRAGELDFDVVIAAPDAMRVVGPLGQVLGPRGLMPNPKTGTVSPDVAAAVKNAKAGQLRYRTDRNGIVHGGVGRVGFDGAAVRSNLEALLADLKKARPASAKGVYIKKIVLSSTMGPGLTIDPSSLAV